MSECSKTGENPAKSTPRKIAIFAKLLIHGPASQPPTRNGLVILQGDKISYAGAASDVSEPFGEYDEIYHVDCCMPGMWDVHSHFLGAVYPSHCRITSECGNGFLRIEPSRLEGTCRV